MTALMLTNELLIVVWISINPFSIGTEAFSPNSTVGEASPAVDVAEVPAVNVDAYVLSGSPTREDVMEEQYKALIAKQANLALKKKLEFEVWLLEQQVRERLTPAQSAPFVTINLIPIMSVHPLVELLKQI